MINIFVSYQLCYLWFCKINVCMLAAKKILFFHWQKRPNFGEILMELKLMDGDGKYLKIIIQ